MLSTSIPGVPSPIVRGLTRMRIAQAFNIFIRSVEIGSREIGELRLRVDAPDVIIRPDVGHIQLLDRVDVRQVARLGDQAVEAALPELKRVVSWPRRLRRRIFRVK